MKTFFHVWGLILLFMVGATAVIWGVFSLFIFVGERLGEWGIIGLLVLLISLFSSGVLTSFINENN